MSEGEGLWVQGVGVPSLLFRFCAHATLGIYSGHAVAVWKMLEGHDIPQTPPYSPGVMRSAQIAEKWSKIAFYWNFALWIPCAIAPNILVMAAGAFDLFLAVQMAISTHLQASWMPRKASHCASVADTWQVPDDDTASIFELVGSFNETVIPAHKVCEKFVNSFNHGVASLVLYSIVAFCNVVIGAVVFFVVTASDNKTHRNQSWYITLLRATWVIPLLILRLIFSLFDLIIAFIPFKIPNMIRFPLRYVTKTVQVLISPVWRRRRRVLSVPEKIKHQVQKVKADADVDMTTIQNKRLLNILHLDTLSLISQHLHYTDMVNLSLASKAVRELTFPASDLRNRQVLYKKYTCEEGAKSICFVCPRQICELCSTDREFGTRLTRTLHGGRCKPYCTKCYIKSSFNHMLTETCHCPSKVKFTSDQGNVRSICRFCAQESIPANTRRCREWERLHLTGENRRIAQCNSCSGALPWWSPKWWVCRLCKRDCWSSVHPPWS